MGIDVGRSDILRSRSLFVRWLDPTTLARSLVYDNDPMPVIVDLIGTGVIVKYLDASRSNAFR
jgi:hypothetical protein